MSAPTGLLSPSASAPLICPGTPGLPATDPPSSPSSIRAPGYPQRRPERTVLYQIVAGHLETFLQEARDRSEHGFGYPRFIERTFRRYLTCGVFSHGFCRLRCSSCGKDMLLPLSCNSNCTSSVHAMACYPFVDDSQQGSSYRYWPASSSFTHRRWPSLRHCFTVSLWRSKYCATSSNVSRPRCRSRVYRLFRS